MNKPVKIKTIFDGKVAIAEHRLEKYKDIGLTFECNGEYMHLSPKDLKTKGKDGDTMFRDKWDKDKLYKLIYFEWKPNQLQPKLIE